MTTKDLARELWVAVWSSLNVLFPCPAYEKMSGAWQPSFDPGRISKSQADDYSSSGSESEEERLLPGQDADDGEFGDYNPRKKRRIGGNNKEKAALGIFGSDSEDDGPASRWKRKTLRSKAMNFVSTADKSKESDKDEEDDEDDDERPVLGFGRAGQDDNESEEADDDEESPAGLGLGFGGASSEQASKRASAAKPAVKSSFNGGGVLGVGFVPSSTYEPVLKEPQNGSSQTPRNKPQQSAFTSKGKMNANSFGARMMAKMGYVEGKGLGKEEQGRNVIIEANLRPQGVGLGAVKEKSASERQEEKRQAELRGETVIDSDEEEKKRKRRRAKQRLGGTVYSSAGSTPRRQKTKYLTAEELKANAPGLHIPDAFTPILDMTGPGGKMLTSTSGLMTPTSGEMETPEAIESRKLVKRAQADLLAFSEEWRSLEERKTWLSLELKEKEQEVEDLHSDFSKLQIFSTLVSEKLVSVATWEDAAGSLREVADFGAITSEVTDIAVAVIHPFFSDWDPLTEPKRFATELTDLAPLLFKTNSQANALSKWNSSSGLAASGVYRRHQKATTSYETMMYKSWLPPVLTAIRSWDAFDATPMLDIIESWKDLLPPFVRAQFIQNIARKLDETLSDWNPRVKRQRHHLPHSWLFPWLQHLPSYHLDPKGTGLVADVRRKFRHLIDAWEFEQGIVPGLTQWEEVLGDQWRPLIMSHVLPSMGKYLRRNFRVDPADQAPFMPILTGVLKWHRVLGLPIIAEVLIQHLFPMWNEKLREWLQLEEVDLCEVADWYGWWRGTVLKDVAGIDGVGQELDKGLVMMNVV